MMMMMMGALVARRAGGRADVHVPRASFERFPILDCLLKS